jgi:cob(I)alamin adenosyltransferase
VARIYTKTGDDGTTGLIGGKRISKDHMRIEAYGSIDELNALLGVVGSYPLPEHVAGMLRLIQDHLFTIGADLAVPCGVDRDDYHVPGLTDTDISALEKEIDECEQSLEPLRQFILPGGTTPGALLHLARTVARRAERRCVSLARNEAVDQQIVRYLNRLSDLCFVLARYVNSRSGQSETHPTFGKKNPS